MNSNFSPESVARMLDHTLLKPEARAADVRRLCVEALRCHFACAVANIWYVPLMAETLHGSDVKVCTIIGFPLGATLPQIKVFEAHEVLRLGAQELDMVINIGALRDGLDDAVEDDIRGVVNAAHAKNALVKVIIEAAMLTDAEKVRACKAAQRTGADFVKTSTGFGPPGARAEDVRLMRQTVGDAMGVKASAGIRTLNDLMRMVDAGANRIGSSASVAIYKEALAASRH